MSENQEFARPRRMSGLKNGSGKTFQNEQREKDRSSHFTMRRSARGNRHATARVGIMGGTFDPIHNGHLVAASEVAWVYDLDEVIFVPVGRPAFKDEQRVAAAEDRYLMTVIATASNPMFNSRSPSRRGTVFHYRSRCRRAAASLEKLRKDA